MALIVPIRIEVTGTGVSGAGIAARINKEIDQKVIPNVRRGFDMVARAQSVAYGMLISRVSMMVARLGAAVAAAPFKAAIEMEAAFRKIGTLFPEMSRTGFEFSNVLIGMDKRLGSTTELAAGYFKVIQSGVRDTEKAAAILEQAAMLAKLGFISIEDAAASVTGVMLAYNDKTEMAAVRTEQLYRGFVLAKTEFGSFAKSIGPVLPFASALNIEFQDLIDTFTFLTRVGVPTQTAMMAIRNTLLKLIKPTEGAKKALGKMFAEFGEWNLTTAKKVTEHFGGLGGLMLEISKRSKEMGIEISEVMTRIRSMILPLAMTTEGMEVYNQVIKESAGIHFTMRDSVEKLTDGFGEQWKALKNNITDWIATAPIILDVAAALKILNAEIAKANRDNVKGGQDWGAPSEGWLEKTLGLATLLRDAAQGAANALQKIRDLMSGLGGTETPRGFYSVDEPDKRVDLEVADALRLPRLLKKSEEAMESYFATMDKLNKGTRFDPDFEDNIPEVSEELQKLIDTFGEFGMDKSVADFEANFKGLMDVLKDAPAVMRILGDDAKALAEKFALLGKDVPAGVLRQTLAFNQAAEASKEAREEAEKFAEQVEKWKDQAQKLSFKKAAEEAERLSKVIEDLTDVNLDDHFRFAEDLAAEFARAADIKEDLRRTFEHPLVSAVGWWDDLITRAKEYNALQVKNADGVGQVNIGLLQAAKYTSLMAYGIGMVFELFDLSSERIKKFQGALQSLSGAMGAFAEGDKVSGIIGLVFTAVQFIQGMLAGVSGEVVVAQENISNAFGEVSQELAEQYVHLKDVGQEWRILENILDEVGVTSENLRAVAEATNQILAGLASGAAEFADGMGLANMAVDALIPKFGELKEQSSGAFYGLMKRIQDAGVETDAWNKYLGETARNYLPALGEALKQSLDPSQFEFFAATAVVAFSQLLRSGMDVASALAQMGEQLDALAVHAANYQDMAPGLDVLLGMREFQKLHPGIMAQLTALAAGMDFLASVGIVSADAFNNWQNSLFNVSTMMTKAGASQMEMLLFMAPQLALARQLAYEYGYELSPQLRQLIQDGADLGMSFEVQKPIMEEVRDLLQDMLDILRLMAGIHVTLPGEVPGPRTPEAGSGTGTPGGSGGTGTQPRGPRFGFAHGGMVPANLHVGEGVLTREATSRLGGAAGLRSIEQGGSGGGSTTIVINVDGQTMFKKNLADLTRTGQARIHANGLPVDVLVS